MTVIGRLISVKTMVNNPIRMPRVDAFRASGGASADENDRGDGYEGDEEEHGERTCLVVSEGQAKEWDADEQ